MQKETRLIPYYFSRDLQTTFITYYTSKNDEEQGEFIYSTASLKKKAPYYKLRRG